MVASGFFNNKEYYKALAEKIIYTGPIDQYYHYCYGALEYRTVRFENEVLNCSNFQGNAVINYTDFEIPLLELLNTSISNLILQVPKLSFLKNFHIRGN